MSSTLPPSQPQPDHPSPSPESTPSNQLAPETAPPPRPASPDIMGELSPPKPPPLSERLAPLLTELDAILQEARERGVIVEPPAPVVPSAPKGDHDGLLEFQFRLVAKAGDVFEHKASVDLGRFFHPSQLHMAPATVQAMLATMLLQPLNTALLDHIDTIKVTGQKLYDTPRLSDASDPLPSIHSDDI